MKCPVANSWYENVINMFLHFIPCLLVRYCKQNDYERSAEVRHGLLCKIVKILIFMFSVMDPDPHESAMILLGWIRICIGNADPHPVAGERNKAHKI
jgi:hypothetical protein